MLMALRYDYWPFTVHSDKRVIKITRSGVFGYIKWWLTSGWQLYTVCVVPLMQAVLHLEKSVSSKSAVVLVNKVLLVVLINI